jgi:NAD(P)-dependent dehydrogenase (short-subunit alcohol dehydrogenase family)
VRDIRAHVPDADLQVLECDLSSQASIRDAARRFLAGHDRLDVLVNAAGVFVKEKRMTPEGNELTFATNYLAYFLLTRELLPLLRSSAPSRVVNVASKYGRTTIDFDDLVNAVHPGLVAGTGLLQDVRGPFKVLTDRFGRTPEEGADTVLWLATAPETATVTGNLFQKRREIRTPGQGSDPAVRRRLWDESERLTA